MACLDTSAILDLIGRRGTGRRPKLLELLSSLVADGEHLATSRLMMAELCIGIELARSREEELQATFGVLEPFIMLELDERGAQAYGRIQADLSRRGLPIDDMDALIAGVAMAHGHSVITANAKHFDRITGLVVCRY